jgi:hypothetical protein
MPPLPTLTAASSLEVENVAVVTAQPIVTVVPPMELPSGVEKVELGCIMFLLSLAVFL